jgi:hypothetical protein
VAFKALRGKEGSHVAREINRLVRG